MKTRQLHLTAFFLLLLTFIPLLGQDKIKTDSLLSVLNKSPHDTTKIDLYISLYREYLNDSTQARDYIGKAIDLSVKLKDEHRFCLSSLALAHFYYSAGLLSEAQGILNEVEKRLSRVDNQTVASSFYMEQGLVSLANGTYENATYSFLKAKRIFEAMGDTVGIGKCHTNLGSVYWTIEDLDKAMEHYQQALKLKKPDDKLGISKVLGNLGLVARAKNDYVKALDYYQQSLKICQENNFELESAINLQNIGVVYEKQKDFDTALQYFIQSNELSKSIGDKIGILYTNIGIAAIYGNLGAYQKAISRQKEALKMAEELDVRAMIKDIHLNLAETYEKMGDYLISLAHRKKYEIWKDSIFSENHLNQVRELEIKYETEKKDKQIILLAQQKELQEKVAQRQATLKNVFIGGAILLALLAGLLWYTLRLRLRNQKTIALKNEEIREVNFKRELTELEMKALQAQINPHFIFNCMNSINEMILNKDNKNASKYLTKFSKLIRMILENAEETEVSLKNELELLEAYIQLETLRFQGNVAYNIKVLGDLDTENVYLPPMVLQPFVENAIWHGLRHRQDIDGGKISVSIEQQENQLVCHIEDNGIGRQKALALQQQSVYQSKSLGLKITEERLRLLSRELKKQLVRITDLKDNYGNAMGTLVEVYIPTS